MATLSSDVSATQFLEVVLTYSFAGAIFAIFSALLFGWPLSLIFNHFGFSKWWQFCLGGAVCAVPLWIAWFYPFNSGHWQAYRITNSIYFYGVGVLGGYIYWLVVAWCQPTNKSSKKDALTRASS